jgi:hypothetical protein
MLQVNINMGHKKNQRNFVLFVETLFPFEDPSLLWHDASRIYTVSFASSSLCINTNSRISKLSTPVPKLICYVKKRGTK